MNRFHGYAPGWKCHRKKRGQPQPSMAQKQPGKKFAGALAKILSAGQKETAMTGIFERRQIINTPKKPL
jgi:hypothetical protein